MKQISICYYNSDLLKYIILFLVESCANQLSLKSLGCAGFAFWNLKHFRNTNVLIPFFVDQTKFSLGQK